MSYNQNFQRNLYAYEKGNLLPNESSYGRSATNKRLKSKVSEHYLAHLLVYTSVYYSIYYIIYYIVEL